MSESAFRASVRSSVRGLWSGTLSRSQFNSALSSAIKRHLQVAWLEGAKDCGIAADELSEDETSALAEFIAEQIGYISGFAGAIREGDKVSKGKLQPLFGRAEMWINRYGEAKSKAKVLACGDKKLQWKINVNCSEHCSSCVGLNGKVKRASYWNKTGIAPRSKVLKCGGWRCCCEFSVTDKPVSRGSVSV
mgnify:CR=1 FL=1